MAKYLTLCLISLALGLGLGWWVNGNRWELKYKSLEIENKAALEMASAAQQKLNNNTQI